MDNHIAAFRRMPHVCGDEPAYQSGEMPDVYVCPTYVGMNRVLGYLRFAEPRMPHVCGDEPAVWDFVPRRKLYAPRMWG
mgnify:CR=1 FL=1